MAGSAHAEGEINPGDLIRVSVFGQEDLNTSTRVSAEGFVNLPLIDQIRVAGLTTLAASELIADLLSKGRYVRNPRVTVYIEQRGSALREVVTIMGNVKRPGRYPVSATGVDASLGDLDGAESVVELLALAGGVIPEGADHLILRRSAAGGDQVFEVDLVAMLQLGDLSENHTLEGGDILLVPRMAEFYVYGEVRRAGRYRLERDMTVLQALAVSGGLTGKGTEKGLSVRRRTGEGNVQAVKVELNSELQKEDVLYVREGLF